VYYLKAFPGEAFEMDDADPATFEALDASYGRDASRIYLNGVALPEADAASFELLERSGFAKDKATSITETGDQRRSGPLRTARRRTRERQSQRLLE
jgi:hypothetical protein